MEQQVKTKVQFADNYNAFTNLENNDSLSTGFGKIHYDLGYLNSEDQRQESEINAIAQAGSKNICPIGTETHSSEIGFGTEYSFPMPEGAYIISFTGTMVAPIQFNVYSESGTRIALVDIHTIEEAESGVRFVLNDNATKCKFWYDTSDNYTLSNIMIRDANITDNTFQPYSPTNRELYDALGGKQGTISDLDTIRSGAALGVTSVQDIQINGTTQTKTNGVVNLPAYPTTLPASDTTNTYSSSGTAPVNGTAVAAALSTLDVTAVGGSGKYISQISEVDGKIVATAQTMDSTPTEESYKAISSDGVWADQQRQDLALAEVENKGAKNLFPYGDLVEITSNFSDKPISIKAGSYRIRFYTSSTTGSYAIRIKDASNNSLFYVAHDNTSTEQGYDVELSADAAKITFYSSASTDFTGIMICTKAEWDISQAYVPYGMTNAELTAKKTDMIDVYGRGIEIPANADLHTYTTPGAYYSPNSVRTATLSNVPTDIISAGFRLVVTEETSVDGSRIRHDLYPIGATYSNFYSENLGSTSTTYPDGWRPWVTYGPITTNPDSATLMNYMAPSAKNFYDDQQRQETEIGVVANAGAKNLLKVSVPDAKANAGNTGFTWSGNTASKNHVSFEIKDDLTVYVKSDTGYTASDTTIFYLTDGSGAYPNTILTGCPVGGSSTTYELRTATPVKSDYGSGVEITSDSATNVVIIIRAGWSGSMTFKPMIRPTAITDPTFHPFARTNRELTVLTDEDRAALVELVDGGAKNVLNSIATTGSSGSLSWTAASDGTITVNGTNDTGGRVDIHLFGNGYLPNIYSGMILSGCKNGQGSSYYILALYSNDGIAWESEKAQYDAPIIIKDSTYCRISIMVQKNSTLNNVVFKPMICTAADWAVSKKFVPYCPTNRELYESKADVSLKPNITSSTSITAYADTFANGNYTAFFTSASLPSDKPVSDNCFVEIFVYSTSTAMVRVTPTGTVYAGTYYEITKVSGTWRDWYKFTGTAVT